MGMRLDAGTTLSHYRILAPLGAGGMGEVYRARDPRLERDVAIKVLPESLAGSTEALARFEREAKVLAALSHPNLVAVFDVGVDRGIHFAVLEYLAGETLRQRLSRGALSLSHVLQIGTALVDGLVAAHAHGIVHRDLKPANIFLTASGQIKILDFGLARWARVPQLEQTLDHLTELGRVLGTAGYMAPEQARGEATDERGDIFALGCILYEMATGRVAFPGRTAVEVLAAVLRDRPAELEKSGTRLPSPLRQLLARCLAKDPGKRFQSAREVADALHSLRRGGTRRAGSAAAPRPRPRPSIAVLPLQNLSANKAETEYIADGLTESLIAELARNRCLRVISRTTVMQYKEARESLGAIAGKVQADMIVEGSVLLAGTSARVTVQLIRAATDEHGWAESYPWDARDVFVLQSELARKVAEEIKLVLFDEQFRPLSRRALATLIRLLGDFDLAEEANEAALAAALEEWPRSGIPSNPRGWLVATGRTHAMELVRRQARHNPALREVAQRLEYQLRAGSGTEELDLEDDRLRLIFTCCHPALPQSTQVALTLREVCGLTTDEIARAFLVSPATIDLRIARGKAKIRAAGIPYHIPSAAELPDRLDSVRQVIYLVFNEGYAASSGKSLIRSDLTSEAIRLGRLVVELLPDAETSGLLALMLLQESRRGARTSPSGDVILLQDQDRSLWNQAQIQEGKSWLQRALAAPRFGPYTIQAAIAAVHATAASAAETDWNQIVLLYDLLLRMEPSPIVALNRAVAVAMRDGPRAGLAQVDEILADGTLADYHLLHAARADFYRQLGETTAARAAYERALALARQEPERRFLQKRLRELEGAAERS